MSTSPSAPPKATPGKPKFLGFMFVGTAPCGCHTAWAWDDEASRKSNAQLVARIVRRGDTLTRIERFAGEPVPQTVCSAHLAEKEVKRATAL